MKSRTAQGMCAEVLIHVDLYERVIDDWSKIRTIAVIFTFKFPLYKGKAP